MLCDVCQRPAGLRCAGCGALVCADHGGERCFRCAGTLAVVTQQAVEVPADTAIYTTDRDSRYSGKGYLQCYTRSELVSIYVDDPGPPSCHACGGLARHICRNCQQLFCQQHRGGDELCRACARSSLVGLWVAGAAILLLILFVFLLG